MRRIITMLTVGAVLLILSPGVAYAVTEKICSTTCKGTGDRDVLMGDEGDTHFYGFDKGDSITDTAKDDADTVKAGAGNDVINVREGGNSPKDVDIANCGAGDDTVYADANDIVRSNCEVVHR